MRFVIRAFAILAVFFNVAYPVFAENSKQVKEIIERVNSNLQNKYDYQINIETTAQTPMGVMVSKDVVFTKKDGRMRKESKQTMGNNEKTDDQLMVIDGEISWIYRKSTNLVQKVDMKKAKILFQENNQPGNLNYLYNVDCEVRESTENGNDYYILKTIKPIEVGKDAKNKAETWINKKTWLVEKQKNQIVQVVNKQSVESVAISIFSNYKFNQKYPDTLFTFEVPKLASVIDSTEDMMQLKENGKMNK